MSILLYACETWTITADIERTQALEMRCFRKLLIISYRDHITNEEVKARIGNAIGTCEDLLTSVKRRKLKWYGHITRSSGLAKTILQGAVQGSRRKGKQRKWWEGSIKEWTGLEWNIILQKAENREEWRKLVVNSTVVPQRSARLWDRWEMRWEGVSPTFKSRPKGQEDFLTWFHFSNGLQQIKIKLACSWGIFLCWCCSCSRRKTFILLILWKYMHAFAYQVSVESHDCFLENSSDHCHQWTLKINGIFNDLIDIPFNFGDICMCSLSTYSLCQHTSISNVRCNCCIWRNALMKSVVSCGFVYICFSCFTGVFHWM